MGTRAGACGDYSEDDLWRSSILAVAVRSHLGLAQMFGANHTPSYDSLRIQPLPSAYEGVAPEIACIATLSLPAMGTGTPRQVPSFTHLDEDLPPSAGHKACPPLGATAASSQWEIDCPLGDSGMSTSQGFISRDLFQSSTDHLTPPPISFSQTSRPFLTPFLLRIHDSLHPSRQMMPTTSRRSRPFSHRGLSLGGPAIQSRKLRCR